MPTVYRKAALGQPQALTALCKTHENVIFSVAKQLLQHDDAAVNVTIAVFKDMLTPKSLETTPDSTSFESRALEQCAALCKQHLTRQNAKSMRVPQDRRFDILNPELTDEATNGNPLDAVLSVFSDLQRMIFVLHAAGMSNEQIVRITKLDHRTLEDAIAAQNPNIDRIVSLCSAKVTADDLVDDFADIVRSAKAPAAVSAQVEPLIKALSASYEKARKKRTLTAVGIVLAVCLVLCGLSAAMIFDMTYGTLDMTSGDNDAESSDTTTTTTISADSVEYVSDITATHYAEITIQDHGTIKVALDANIAPKTVENFKSLADSDFYDGLTFHRIMEGFMMQGGDPNGNGTGGSDESIVGEFVVNGYDNHLSHIRGAISMARSSDYNSASSQFFIVHEDSTFLDGQYAAFGYVTEGMDIVDAICSASEPTDDNGTIVAADQPIITDLIVYEATV